MTDLSTMLLDDLGRSVHETPFARHLGWPLLLFEVFVDPTERFVFLFLLFLFLLAI